MAHGVPTWSRMRKVQNDRGGSGTGAHCVVHHTCDGKALRRTGDQSPRPCCHGIVPALQHEGRLEELAQQVCSGESRRTAEAEHKAAGP